MRSVALPVTVLLLSMVDAEVLASTGSLITPCGLLGFIV